MTIKEPFFILLLITNVIFSYDINQDIWNYFFRYIDPILNPEHQLNNIIQGKPSLPKITESLINELPSIATSERAIVANKIYNFLDKNLLKSKFFDQSINEMNNAWSKYDDKYFYRLKKYFGIKQIRPMKGYFTSINGCPYNANAGTFFVPLDGEIDKRIKLVMHETMHIVFRDNFERYMCNHKIDNDGVFLINETVAELLDTEFQDINPVKNDNHSKAKGGTEELINRMDTMRKAGNNFHHILDELIKMVLQKTEI